MYLIPFTFGKKSNINKTQKVIITFDSPITSHSVVKTHLRYNKKFAVTIEFDDSLQSQALTVLPSLQGGSVRYQNLDNTYDYELNVPPRHITDGCGNDVFFSFIICFIGSWILDTPSGRMSIDQFQKVYQSGNNYTNHSFEHRQEWYQFAPIKTIGTSYVPNIQDREDEIFVNKFVPEYSYYIASQPGNYVNFGLTGVVTNDILMKNNTGWEIRKYNFTSGIPIETVLNQIKLNYEWAKQYTGCKIKTFCKPGNYVPYDSFVKSLGYMSNRTGPKLLPIQTTIADGYPLLMGADNLRDDNLEEIKNNIHFAFNNSTEGNNYRYSLFTHDPDRLIGTTGGISYSKFKEFLNFVEDTYGKKGNDSVWMTDQYRLTSYTDTFTNTIMTEEVIGNQLIITFDYKNCLQDVREHALSFKINSPQNIVSVVSENIDSLSYNTNTKLINISTTTDFEASLMKRLNAKFAVEEYEKITTEEYKIIAQNYVNELAGGTLRDDLQARIDAVIPIANGFKVSINLTKKQIGQEMPFPWNNLQTNTNGFQHSNLLNSKSEVSNINFISVSGWDPVTEGSGLNEEFAGYPSEAVRSNWKSRNLEDGIVKFTGLDNSKIYDISLLCLRKYVGRVQTIVINGISQTVDAKNDPKLLTFSNLTTTNNEITIVTSCNEINRINLIELTEYE